MSGSADAGALERALREVLRRHEALRTRFVTTLQGVLTCVDPPGPAPLTHVDLTGLPVAARMTHTLRLVCDLRLLTFELDGGRLMRAWLLRINTDFQLALLGIHHIVTDGWSNSILLHEMRVLYEAYRTGRASPLPEPRLQYGDFSIWERKWLESCGDADPYRYWDQRLREMEPMELPADAPRNRDRLGSPEARLSFQLPASTTQGLRTLGRDHGVTALTSLLAVYILLLARWSGRRSVLIGCYMACRAPPGVEKLVGCFAVNRPLPLEVHPRDTFSAHLERVRQANVEMQDLCKLVSLPIAWQKRLNAVIANFIRSDKVESPNLQAFLPENVPYPVYHELSLSLTETPAGIQGVVSYAGDLFLPTRIAAFVEDFLALASSVSQRPRLAVADIIHGH